MGIPVFSADQEAKEIMGKERTVNKPKIIEKSFLFIVLDSFIKVIF